MTNKPAIHLNKTEISILRKENEGLKAENAKLKRDLDWLKERLKLNDKKQFGISSEKTSGQIHIFNEAETYAKISEPEPELEKVKEHYRKAKRKSTKDRLPDNLPVEVVECELPEDERNCPSCGEQLHAMGKETVREELKIIPAKVELRRYVRKTYSCRNCEKTDIKVPVIKAPVPKAVIKGGFASPEIVAYIATQKYVLSVPLFRQEQEFKRGDIFLSRQTMCNWLIKVSETWLQPIYDRLHEELINNDILHADETTVHVLEDSREKRKKEKKKKSKNKTQGKSYMWLYRTGKYADRAIAMYEYAPGRGADYVKEFLKGFSGYLHCDGYKAYKDLDDVILVECWAHARRKFHDAIVCLPKEQQKGTKALIGLEFCNELFKIEKEIKKLSPEEIKTQRQEQSEPVLDAFLSWLNTFENLPKSHFGEAIKYARNQWEYLQNYLLDGRLEASNNEAERLAKSFAVCRKNFLFSNTSRGAKSSAVILTITATAMANNLNPYRYLVYIFQKAPNLNLADPEQLEQLMPWNAPEYTKLAAE